MKLWLSLFLFLDVVFAVHATTSGPKSVAATRIKAGEIFDTLGYPAQILPRIEANVLAESQGSVEKIFVSLGKHVQKGEALISIKQDDPAYNYVPMKITSPVSGVVAQILTTEGNIVGKAQALLKIIDPTSYKIKIEITSSDLAGLKQGMQGTLLLAGAGGEKKSYPVRIVGMSPVLDPNTGTSPAELELVSSADKNEKVPVLPLGELGQVVFQANLHQGIEIAVNAINYFGTKAFLNLIEEQKVKKVEVEVGPRRKGNVEILRGLKDNDVVVVRSTSFLSEGDVVAIENEKDI